MDISIIIPVHNAERFLNRCLASVERAVVEFQGEAEVIIVDDHSTDDSFLVAQKWAKSHLKHTEVLRSNTSGASASRNLGTSRARGEFLWFIDADDTIAPTAISKLVTKARKTRADLVMLGAKRQYLNGKTAPLAAISPTDPEWKHRFVRAELGPWQVIIRRKWFLCNDFAFREGIIHEDMELMPALVLHTNNYACVEDTLYTYYETPGSVLHKKKWDGHYLDIFPALEGLYKRFADMGAVRDYSADLEWFFIWNLLVDAARDFKRFPEGRVGFSRSRRLLMHYFPHWRHNKFLWGARISGRFRLKIFLAYWGIVLY